MEPEVPLRAHKNPPLIAIQNPFHNSTLYLFKKDFNIILSFHIFLGLPGGFFRFSN
jgi:hypothetical protein